MTTDDAILTLRDIKKFMVDDAWFDAVDTAIEALEKQIPKKVGHRHLRKTEYGSHYYCGNCEADLVKVEFFSFDGGEPENKVSYCWHCGNAVDWSENDD